MEAFAVYKEGGGKHWDPGWLILREIREKLLERWLSLDEKVGGAVRTVGKGMGTLPRGMVKGGKKKSAELEKVSWAGTSRV